MNKEYTLLIADIKNKNGRIYPLHEVQKGLDRRKENTPLVITNGNNNDGIFSFHDAVGVIENLELKRNELVGTIRPLDGKDWIIPALEEGKLFVRTAGHGFIKDDGTVYDFVLTHTILTDDPA